MEVDYHFLASSFTVLRGVPGTLQMQVNFEGECAGLGPTLGTMQLSRDGEHGGTWSCEAASFPDDAPHLTSSARGKVLSAGTHLWNTLGVLRVSDGGEFDLEGTLDFRSRSWQGCLKPR